MVDGKTVNFEVVGSSPTGGGLTRKLPPRGVRWITPNTFTKK